MDPTELTMGIAPHDMVNQDDVCTASDYVTDMFQRFYDCEVGVASWVAQWTLIVVLFTMFTPSSYVLVPAVSVAHTQSPTWTGKQN